MTSSSAIKRGSPFARPVEADRDGARQSRSDATYRGVTLGAARYTAARSSLGITSLRSFPPVVDFPHMDKPAGITRKDFIAIVAGVIGVALLARFSGLGGAVKAITKSRDSDGAYGGTSYGS
jgi:hypothetical protein